jgi:heat shock protein HslJ
MRSLLVVLALVVLSATAQAGGALVVLEVGPRTVPCGALESRRCVEVRRAGEAAFHPLEGEIVGFTHRAAHAAVLVVREESVQEGALREGVFELLHVLLEVPLGGAVWRLERYGSALDGRTPLPHVDVSFAVASGGTLLTGSTGCNRVVAPIAVEGEVVRIGPLALTRRICDDDVMEQEREVVAALEEARRLIVYGDAVAFAGEARRLRLSPELSDAPLAWVAGPGDPDLERFAASVAAAAGERWTLDPIRVALAFVDSRGAPRVDVSRRDDRAESPRFTVVRIDEDGFLDDSVRGVLSELVLVPDDAGVWQVAALRVATRCWRGDALVVAPGEACP